MSEATHIELEHPGIILREEFIEPLGISLGRLAEVTGIPKGSLSKIVNGKYAITAETGIRLSRAFGLSDGYFYRLQTAYSSEQAAKKLANLGIEVRSVVS